MKIKKLVKKNNYKKAISDMKVIRSIINDTVNVYDYHCLDFVRDFDSYLEFEKKHFSKKSTLSPALTC